MSTCVNRPYDPNIRADLRAVTKQVSRAGNVRFTAERNADGHADRFWALALALHAAGNAQGPTYATSRPRQGLDRIGGLSLAGY